MPSAFTFFPSCNPSCLCSRTLTAWASTGSNLSWCMYSSFLMQKQHTHLAPSAPCIFLSSLHMTCIIQQAVAVIVHLQQAFKILVNGPKGPLRNRVGKNMEKKWERRDWVIQQGEKWRKWVDVSLKTQPLKTYFCPLRTRFTHISRTYFGQSAGLRVQGMYFVWGKMHE